MTIPPFEEELIIDRETTAKKKSPLRRGLLLGGAFIVGFVILGIVSIRVWEATNTSAFCAYVCHDVHPEEPSAYQDSYHAEVKCVECHMGRVSTLRKIVLKASHARHLPETIFRQYGRPLEAETLIPPDQSCERCHWPPAFHGNTVREIQHYQSDYDNTLIRTYLNLRTGSGGAKVETIGEGIHWHIANHVEYIRDEESEEIRWVRASFPDGRVVAYNDVTDPMDAAEIEAGELHGIDCVDCHNQVGHPFYPPDRLVDLALETGQLSSELPYAKKIVVDLLSQDYATQADAIAAMDSVRAQYERTYPEVAQEYEQEIEQTVDVAKSLVQVVVFEAAGLTWESFPDHSGHGGHKPFPGCFRCHNGKFQSEDGTPIRVQCTLCHSIPEKAGPGERVPAVPAAARQQPESHQDADFLADHRWQATDACAECHGEIEFGADDSSFCANSACHGQVWPELELDPTQEHPVPLVGEHAEVWCHDCHAGARMPEYACETCHEPPADHYPPPCDACHSPVGWLSVMFGDAEEPFDLSDHPFPLDHGGADRDCRLCHPQGDATAYSCFVCHQPEKTLALHTEAGIPDIFGKCSNCHP